MPAVFMTMIKNLLEVQLQNLIKTQEMMNTLIKESFAWQINHLQSMHQKNPWLENSWSKSEKKPWESSSFQEQNSCENSMNHQLPQMDFYKNLMTQNMVLYQQFMDQLKTMFEEKKD